MTKQDMYDLVWGVWQFTKKATWVELWSEIRNLGKVDR